VTAADYQAVAEWVGALAALIGVGVLGWAKGLPAALASWSRVRMRRATSLLFSREVAALPSTVFNPEVSLEAGIAYARQAARSGHPPYTVTQGRVSAGSRSTTFSARYAKWSGRPSHQLSRNWNRTWFPSATTWALLSRKRAGPRRVTSPWASSPSGCGRKKTAGPTSPARSKSAPGAARLTGIQAATCASWSASIR